MLNRRVKADGRPKGPKRVLSGYACEHVLLRPDTFWTLKSGWSLPMCFTVQDTPLRAPSHRHWSRPTSGSHPVGLSDLSTNNPGVEYGVRLVFSLITHMSPHGIGIGHVNETDSSSRFGSQGVVRMWNLYLFTSGFLNVQPTCSNYAILWHTGYCIVA